MVRSAHFLATSEATYAAAATVSVIGSIPPSPPSSPRPQAQGPGPRIPTAGHPPALRLHHGGLEPRPAPVGRIAHDVDLLLGLVAHLEHLDPEQLLLEHLRELVELLLVLRGHDLEEEAEAAHFHPRHQLATRGQLPRVITSVRLIALLPASACRRVSAGRQRCPGTRPLPSPSPATAAPPRAPLP